MNKQTIKHLIFIHFNIQDCKQLKKRLPEALKALKALDLRKKASWVAIAEKLQIDLNVTVEKPKPPAVAKAAKKEVQLVLLKKLVHCTVDLWDLKELEMLGAHNLASLCKLLGIRHTGTRAAVIERMRNAIAVRIAIGQHQEPETLVEAHKGKELKQWCRMAKAYCGGTKYSMATALLNWRNECKKKGLEYWKQAIAIRKAKVAQAA